MEYQNITVPYYKYNKQKRKCFFWYGNKEYDDLYKLFKKFLGGFLTYHIEVNGDLIEVHTFEDVLEKLVKNSKTFFIPRKYIKEYSQNEYDYLIHLQKDILNDKLVLTPDPTEAKFMIVHSVDYKVEKRIREEYCNTKVPKKVFIKEFDDYFYCVNGTYHEDLVSALGEVYNRSLYYEFGGKNRKNASDFYHSHEFKNLVMTVIRYFDKFNIHKFQEDCYSKQELEFLGALSNKLKSMNFKPIRPSYDYLDMKEYEYELNNHHFFRALIMAHKFKKLDRKFKEEELECYKI